MRTKWKLTQPWRLRIALVVLAVAVLCCVLVVASSMMSAWR